MIQTRLFLLILYNCFQIINSKTVMNLQVKSSLHQWDNLLRRRAIFRNMIEICKLYITINQKLLLIRYPTCPNKIREINLSFGGRGTPPA
jgi:hypothetical protein